LTFSIVAWDPETPSGPEWGIAVASKFLAVGAVVPWARAGAGGVATQAFANLSYGPDGLERLAAGDDAASVVKVLTEPDDMRGQRQLGVVDARGGAATYTGMECFDWAGGTTGDGYCCQGNILAGPQVIDAMRQSFESTSGELAHRLMAGIAAGDEAGGDRRGRQSASVVVVRAGGGYGGATDRALDLRVDDHLDPVAELGRLLDLHRLYFPRPEDLEFVDVDESLARELKTLLSRLGYDAGGGEGYDDDLRSALYAYAGTENLEERWTDEPRIELRVLEHLRAQS
jgi:uncharacterized Ntn-hydrolase superfamily protein